MKQNIILIIILLSLLGLSISLQLYWDTIIIAADKLNPFKNHSEELSINEFISYRNLLFTMHLFLLSAFAIKIFNLKHFHWIYKGIAIAILVYWLLVFFSYSFTVGLLGLMIK